MVGASDPFWIVKRRIYGELVITPFLCLGLKAGGVVLNKERPFEDIYLI